MWDEAGIGKTSLLERLVESVSGLKFLRGSGVESEMELAYASLSPGAVDTEMLRTANPNFARSSRASIMRRRRIGQSAVPVGRTRQVEHCNNGQKQGRAPKTSGAAWQRSSTSSPFDTPTEAPANWGR